MAPLTHLFCCWNLTNRLLQDFKKNTSSPRFSQISTRNLTVVFRNQLPYWKKNGQYSVFLATQKKRSLESVGIYIYMYTRVCVWLCVCVHMSYYTIIFFRCFLNRLRHVHQELAIGVSLPLWRAVREDNLEARGCGWKMLKHRNDMVVS